MEKIITIFDLDEHPDLFKPLSTELSGAGIPRPGQFRTIVMPGKTQIIVEAMEATDEATGKTLPVLAIIDKSTGAAMSLTNNMENVLTHVSRILNIDVTEIAIVYRDSENQWDGVRVRTFRLDKEIATLDITRVDFVSLDCRTTGRDAARIMLQKNLEINYPTNYVG